jgi:hypothetical protein
VASVRRGRHKKLATEEEILSVCEQYYLLDQSVERIAARMRVSPGPVLRVLKERGAEFCAANKDHLDKKRGGPGFSQDRGSGQWELV